MVRPAVAVGRIAMTGQDDLRVQLRRPGRRRFEVIDLEPQEDAVAVREAGVADGAVMVLDFPTVQLQDQSSLRNEPFVIGSAMVAPAAQEPLVPTAAGFDIAHADERLWVHGIGGTARTS